MSEASWRDTLPEDLKADPNLVKFNDVPSLAKSYKELSAKVGSKAYDLPKEDWKPEQWSEWNKLVGVPETPDKYAPVDEQVLTKTGVTKESLGDTYKKFHEMGLTPRQAKNLTDWYFGNLSGQIESETASKAKAAQEAESTLKGKYGDKYGAKLELVKSVVKRGGSDFAERIEKAGFGNDPGLFDMLVSLGEAFSEDTSRRGGEAGLPVPKQDALNEISQLKGNKDFMARFTSGEKEAVKKWNDLHQKAYS